MRRHLIKFNYIFIPLATFLVAVASSRFISIGLGWYATLNVPRYTPSGATIGMIWSIVFILTAFSIMIYWNRSKHKGKFWAVMGLFLFTGMLNVLWAFHLFLLHQPLVSLIDMIVLNLTLLVLIILSWKKSKVSSILLFPYSFWAVFFTVLNYFIIILN